MAFQARWVEGKSVAKVEAPIVEPRQYGSRRKTVIGGILFTDGSRLGLYAAETDWDPVVLPVYRPTKKKGKRP